MKVKDIETSNTDKMPEKEICRVKSEREKHNKTSANLCKQHL